MNLEEIKKLVFKVGVVISLFCLIPFIVYICKFHDHVISNIPSDWGVFGDYIVSVRLTTPYIPAAESPAQIV